MGEPGVRPWFWVTIIAAVVLLAMIVRGYWEWAVVGLIAVMALNRLPPFRRRR